MTRGPRAHWFGYYDKPPWDASMRRMIALEAEPMERLPEAGEPATVGLVDLESGAYEPVAETRAWNWQQGCMAQWLATDPDRRIVFNDCRDGRHVAVVLDVRSGAERVLPRPVYAVSPDGRWALSLSLARLARERPIVGYRGASDPFADEPAPAGDGLWRMDLETGDAELILSLKTAARHDPDATMAGAVHRFEHATISPDGRRFFVLQRWPRPGKGRPFYDRLLTANARDGSDLHVLAGNGLVSHFDWRDPEHVLAWAKIEGRGAHFYLFRDRTDEARIVGGDVLTRDGHCSYSPDRRWVLSDEYPDADWTVPVLLYEVATGRRVDVGRFRAPRRLYKKGGIRCDLHPRWRPDGRAVCIDSAHAGPRQMYVLDVSGVVLPS